MANKRQDVIKKMEEEQKQQQKVRMTFLKRTKDGIYCKCLHKWLQGVGVDGLLLELLFRNQNELRQFEDKF